MQSGHSTSKLTMQSGSNTSKLTINNFDLIRVYSFPWSHKVFLLDPKAGFNIFSITARM